MGKIGGRRAKRQRIADYAVYIMEPGARHPAREIVRMMVDYIPYSKEETHLIMSKAYINACYDIPCQYELIKILKGDSRFSWSKDRSNNNKLVFFHMEGIDL